MRAPAVSGDPWRPRPAARAEPSGGGRAREPRGSVRRGCGLAAVPLHPAGPGCTRQRRGGAQRTWERAPGAGPLAQPSPPTCRRCRSAPALPLAARSVLPHPGAALSSERARADPDLLAHTNASPRLSRAPGHPGCTNGLAMQMSRPLHRRATGSSCSRTPRSLCWLCWAGPLSPMVQHHYSSNSVVITARMQSCIVLARMRSPSVPAQALQALSRSCTGSRACARLRCPPGEGTGRHRLQLCNASCSLL